MKKLMVLALLLSLFSTIGVVDNPESDVLLHMDSKVMVNHDPGDGGMGSWK
ncbi:hypothetical protein ACGTN9_01565 [Halobacillus sp. MO56]